MASSSGGSILIGLTNTVLELSLEAEGNDSTSRLEKARPSRVGQGFQLRWAPTVVRARCVVGGRRTIGSSTTAGVSGLSPLEAAQLPIPDRGRHTLIGQPDGE